MKRLKSKHKLLILAVAAFIFTSLIVSCSNSSGGGNSGSSDKTPAQPSGNDDNGGNGGDGGNGGNGGDKATIPVGGTSVDDPIKFNVSIPANTEKVTIERQEINSNKGPLSDWYKIGEAYNDSNNPEYSVDKIKEFKDTYGVVKNKYYAYRIIYDYDYTNLNPSTYKYFKSGYDGLIPPAFKTGVEASYNISYDQWKHEIEINYWDRPFVLKNNEKSEDLDYWNIELRYNDKIYPYVDDANHKWKEPVFVGDPKNRVVILNQNIHNTFDTGINKLTYISIGCWFKDEYFGRHFKIDLDDIDENLIEKEFIKFPEQVTNTNDPHLGWMYIKFEWPHLPEGCVLDEINIQRRKHDPNPWALDLDKDRVGYLDGEDLVNRNNDGVFEFYDKYGFVKDQKYQYRALFVYHNEHESNKILEFPLGEVTPDDNGDSNGPSIV